LLHYNTSPLATLAALAALAHFRRIAAANITSHQPYIYPHSGLEQA
jgi:hypothetical protein